MALREEFESTGGWLFRWRSYLPLLLFSLSPLAMQNFRYPGHKQVLDLGWEFFCMAVSFAGLGVRIFTIGYAANGTSGRNTTKQVAKSLNTTGMYSVVRHPLYLGNFMIWLGISLFFGEWWFSLIVSLAFWLYYERIMFAEEAFLREKFGEEFLKWAGKTPAFVPKIKNWVRPVSPFDIRTILRREQSGLMAIVATFTFLEVAEDFISDGRLEIESIWAITFVVALSIYLTLSGLKKAKIL